MSSENKVERELAEAVKSLQETVATTMKSQGEENGRAIKAAVDELRSELEPKIKKLASTGASISGLEHPNEQKKFSVARLVRSIVAPHSGEQAGYEREVCAHAAKVLERDINASSGGAGGYIIPIEISEQIIPLPQANTVAKKAGATFLTGLQGNLPIPKILTRPSLQFIGETAAVTEGNVTFGEVNMQPRRGAMLCKISKRVIMQTADVAEMLVREQMNIGVALGMDGAIFNGTGGSNQPLGIFNSGITSTNGAVSGAVATNGGRFQVKHARSMIKTLDVANLYQSGGKFAHIMRPEVLYGLMNERVAQYSGQPAGDGMPVMMLNPFLTQNQLADGLGNPIFTTTQFDNDQTQGTSSTNSTVLFGDFSYVKVGQWGGIEIDASTQAGDSNGSAFTQNQVWITVNLQMDVAVGNSNAFTKMAGAETVESKWAV